jgi:hypothetical protein
MVSVSRLFHHKAPAGTFFSVDLLDIVIFLVRPIAGQEASVILFRRVSAALVVLVPGMSVFFFPVLLVVMRW